MQVPSNAQRGECDLTYPQTIVLAATLIVIAVMLTVGKSPLQAEDELGQYRLVASSQFNMNGIFRVNLTTGDVSYCFVEVEEPDDLWLTCTSPATK